MVKMLFSKPEIFDVTLSLICDFMIISLFL